MARVHREVAFDYAIEASLLASGWHRGIPDNYRRDLGLDTSELHAFIGATQPDEWQRRLAYHGGDSGGAMRSFERLVAKEIDERGALDVLRHRVKDRGIKFRLAYFRRTSAWCSTSFSMTL
jgi:type I restriction enzyme R subunit